MLRNSSLCSHSKLACDSLLEYVGNTPLIHLKGLDAGIDDSRVELYAKAEWFNAGGSVKDRAALRIVSDAEQAGTLTHAKTILESTSGNTGIALAMIGAAKGYRVEIIMPSNASEERKRIIESYGAKVTYTSPFEGTDGAQMLAHSLFKENADTYFYANQYGADSNWRAHYDSTGIEVYRQTESRITHFVAGVGTGGTIMGTGRRLKEYNPDIRVLAIEPSEPLHGIEGLKHMASSIKPAIYDECFPDGTVGVKTDEAHQWVQKLAKERGLFIGLSGGAAIAGALKVAETLETGVIVTILPDAGTRYLSLRL
ncbi:MAG: cysteine synthase family protein [Candidatus Abyssobacteria bacterium SURF_17]|uniref:Cysteine synthase family protein n=1 Tax=Candidatus Abyssobacteria bacterium SURF_17 TaxID=2093361 RepID=A0A419F9D8_9BACT|nr:MAG: cysteine synthase family protein [Candidatus Abyssubacteria bacterium SURF_17]